MFGRVTVITPNIDEAILLSKIDIIDLKDMYKAAEIFLKNGCRNVLMKGGHLKGHKMTDILFSQENEPLILSADQIVTDNTHGTGCTLSSAIASYLALGHELYQAVTLAKDYITSALQAGAGICTGKGHGPLNHFFNPKPLTEKPLITDITIT